MDRDPTPNAHAARRRKHDPADSDAHAHRRETDVAEFARLHGRVDDIAGMVGGNTRDISRIDSTLAVLVKNMQDMADDTAEMKNNTARTADMLEAWGNVKGFWWTLAALGTLTKLLTPILLLIAAVWLFAKTGQWKWP